MCGNADCALPTQYQMYPSRNEYICLLTPVKYPPSIAFSIAFAVYSKRIFTRQILACLVRSMISHCTRGRQTSESDTRSDNMASPYALSTNRFHIIGIDEKRNENEP